MSVGCLLCLELLQDLLVLTHLVAIIEELLAEDFVFIGNSNVAGLLRLLLSKL